MVSIHTLPIVGQWVKDYEEAKPYADPRTKNWLMVYDSPYYVWAVTSLYFLFVLVGPRLMKNRPAFNIPLWFIATYNLGLVALSLYMFIEIYYNFYVLDYKMMCAPYNEETRKNPAELRLAKVLWWYFFSKVIEMMDTVLMVLRKKSEQVTFLHVFHHASMLNIWWWVMMFIPGGCSFFGSSTNCFVHVVMYAYYGLAAIPSLKNKLWWKRYITRLQLVQFIVTFSHSSYMWHISDCDFPIWAQKMLSIYSIALFVLFGNFYIQSYLAKPSNKTQDSSKKSDIRATGDTSNVSNGKRHKKKL